MLNDAAMGSAREDDLRLAERSANSHTERRIPGEEGLWIVIFGDITVFAMFFVTYIYSRAKNPVQFAEDQEYVHLVLGTINTVVLLCSSLAVVFGVASVLSGDHRRAPRFFVMALTCGFGFMAVKAIEWAHLLLLQKSPGTSEFFMYYYLFTGAHLVHVIIGCICLGFMIRMTRTAELSSRKVMLCECGGIFWHMVDFLWVFLFALFYLVR